MIIQSEFEMNLRLLGARDLKEVTREMVDASNIGLHVVEVPRDRLFNNNCKLIPVLSLWLANTP
jgi:L-lactate dehydrogenase (cytochrome)